MQIFANNAESTIGAPMSAVALSMQVAAGTGARFPSPASGQFFKLTLSKVVAGIENEIEIVKVTARDGDVLTIERAQELTAPLTHAVGDMASMRSTADSLNNLSVKTVSAKDGLYGNLTGNASSATALATGRAITILGDANGTANFNGTADSTIDLTLATVVAPGIYRSVTVNDKGLVIEGTNPTTLAGAGIVDALEADTAALTYAPRTGAGTSGTWPISVTGTAAGITEVNPIATGGTGAATAAGALTALGAYPATNPAVFITAAGAPVQSVAGFIGAVTKTQLEIDQLDNTRDAAKPVSAATAAALALKAPLAGPTFTGPVIVPNVAAGNNSTLAANTAFVTAAVAQGKADLVGSAPAALDTLNEFAAALGNDPNFATTNATAMGNRLRVDTSAQGLTPTQKANAVTNLGLAAVSTSGAKADIGLGHVDDTSDDNKPVSGPQATALAGKAPLTGAGTSGTWPISVTGTAAGITEVNPITTGGTGAATAAGALTALGAYPANNPAVFITAAGAPVQSVAGFTGAVTKTQLEIDQLDNTRDAAKPMSTATVAALALKAPLAGPTFTGPVNVPNVAAGNNSTLAANTAFVTAAVAQGKADLVNSAPAALDTLNEFAAALGNDPNFATTNATAMGNRLRVDTPTQGLTAEQKSNAATNLGLADLVNAQVSVALGPLAALIYAGL